MKTRSWLSGTATLRVAALLLWYSVRGTHCRARSHELVRTQIISSLSGLCPSYILATALSERIAVAVALVMLTPDASRIA